MIQTIYITRDDAGGIISRGLGNVYVWFHEPCLMIRERNTDMFSLDNSLYLQLQGILYSKNAHHNFLYRKENDCKSEFGEKLIRNDDGVDFPQILVDLKNEWKLTFKHEVFGSGSKVGYRPNSVGNVFGYDNEVSHHIWKMIIDEFKEEPNMRKWKDVDGKEWWRFCRKMEIEVNLPKIL